MNRWKYLREGNPTTFQRVKVHRRKTPERFPCSDAGRLPQSYNPAYSTPREILFALAGIGGSDVDDKRDKRLGVRRSYVRLLQSCITGVMQRRRTFFKMCPQPAHERNENREDCGAVRESRQRITEHGAHAIMWSKVLRSPDSATLAGTSGLVADDSGLRRGLVRLGETASSSNSRLFPPLV